MSADWCVSDGALSICGTRMVERSRTLEQVAWCFGCRQRRQFVRVIKVPDGPSYYGPTVDIRCDSCGLVDGDCFPGRYREWLYE